MTDIDPMLRKAIKLLLLQLASKTDNPSVHLERILGEVITELYTEAQETLKEKRRHLQVVGSSATS